MTVRDADLQQAQGRSVRGHAERVVQQAALADSRGDEAGEVGAVDRAPDLAMNARELQRLELRGGYPDEIVERDRAAFAALERRARQGLHAFGCQAPQLGERRNDVLLAR